MVTTKKHILSFWLPFLLLIIAHMAGTTFLCIWEGKIVFVVTVNLEESLMD